MTARKRTLNKRYRLLHQLGSGGMGSVWLAEDLLLGRTVALKELLGHHGGGDRDERRRRSLREAQALARVAHPAIVTIYDVFVERGDPWLVMEHVAGRSLGELIDGDGPLDERTVARIGLRVVGALTAAHDAGVLHRDVKPPNILVRRHDDQVFLADFGIAQITGGTPLTAAGSVLGTIEYLAPERINGGPVGPPADLWSLGVTFFYALEGYSPFQHGDNAAATFWSILNDPSPALRREGPLSDAVRGLLHKDPAKRLTATDLIPLLRSVIAPAPAVPAKNTPHRTESTGPTPAARPNRAAGPSARPGEDAPAARPHRADPPAQPHRAEPAEEPNSAASPARPGRSEPPPPPRRAEPPPEARADPPARPHRADPPAQPHRAEPAGKSNSAASPARPGRNESAARPRRAEPAVEPGRSADAGRGAWVAGRPVRPPGGDAFPEGSPEGRAAAGDVARRLHGMPPEEAAALLARLGGGRAGEVLAEAGPVVAGPVLLAMPRLKAAQLLMTGPTEVTAAWLEQMAAARPRQAAAVLQVLSPSLGGRALGRISRTAATALVAALPTVEAVRFLGDTDLRAAAGVISALPMATAVRLVEAMSVEGACKVLRYVPPVTIAALLDASGDGRTERLLQGFSHPVRVQVLRHLHRE